MADILSQEEIDALLEVVEEEDIAPEEIDKASDILDNRQITLYDFKRPNRVSKEQLRSIRAIHDKMARSLAKRYIISYEKHSRNSAPSVDQMTYGDFLMRSGQGSNFRLKRFFH